MKRWQKYLVTIVGAPVLVFALAVVALSVTTEQIGMSGKQVYTYDQATGFARMQVIATSAAGSVFGLATNAAPSVTEGASVGFSFTLANAVRVFLSNLISGEDVTNNLIMTSGGATRITQLVGTGGIPSTATDATTAAFTLPVGTKTFHSVVTCTGTCVQTQKVYGAFESSATVAKSTLVCTLTNNASTTATDWCQTNLPYSYWFVVTSATSGTTPLAGLFAMY